MKIKESKSRKIFQVCNYTILLIFTFLCVYPFWYIIIYTFSDPAQVVVDNPVFLPSGFSLFNYKEILKLGGFLSALLISVLRTLVGTGFTIVACSFLGYMFTQKELPGRKFWYRFMVLTMYVSGGMIPCFITMKAYGLLNNFWVYILPATISAYYVILVKTYMESLPASLEESAKLDGAGYLTIYAKIVLPLSKPIIATIGVFSAVGHWNSWFDNHIYTRGAENLTTLQYLLYNYLNQAQRLASRIQNAGSDLDSIGDMVMSISPKGVRMTITVLAVLPIFLVYPFVQKYFTKGIMIGAVKG